MAKSIADEEIHLRKRARRRLVGAVALVLLAVVFLPMVLDREPKPVSQDIDIRIPERSANDFAPLPGKDGAAPPAAAAPAQQAEPHAADVAAVPAQPPAAAVAPKPVAAPAAEAATKAAPKKPETHAAPAKPAPAAKEQEPRQMEMFVVQLGAFSNPANAKQLLAKLSAHKVKGYIEVLKTPSGDKTRVRAGPYGTKEEAEKAKAHLQALGIKGGEVVPKMVQDKGRKAAGKG